MARMANRLFGASGPELCDKCTQKIVNIIIDIVAEEEERGRKRENDEHFINKIKS